MSNEQYHIPVMLGETVDALQVKKDGLYLDGTLGGGGHTEEILKRGGRVIAFDRDAEAVGYVEKRFSEIPRFAGRCTIYRDNFKNVNEVLTKERIDRIDGAVLDLGISSRQIDVRERGFSYTGGAVVDMRMDQSQEFSAKTILNEYSEADLSRIIYTYGEERNARKIAREIVRHRAVAPIERTDKLAEIVASCFPPFCKGGHPAKRTFQALRIEVNGELDGLKEAFTDIIGYLNPGGRIAVISFHSLEDRAAKQTFKELSLDCVCDKSLPVCVCNHKAAVKLIGKGEKPSPEEQAANPRSKSATLRIAEKL